MKLRRFWIKKVRSILSSRRIATIPKTHRNHLGILRTARTSYNSFRYRELSPVKTRGDLKGFRVKIKQGFNITSIHYLIPLQLFYIL